MRARTTVYAWSGKLKSIDRRYGHMRIIRDPEGRKSLLLFQKSEANRFFSRKISVMAFDQGGKPSVKEDLPRIKGLQIYSLALLDLDGDGAWEIVGLDEHEYLRVWDSKGKGLWKSEDKIGGTNNAVEVGREDKDLLLPQRFAFNSSVIAADVDKDGREEILVIKNIPVIGHVENFKFYLKGHLVAYTVEGTSLFPAWKTRNMNYCLTDIQTDGETLILAAQKGKFDNITKGSGRIMWFE
jgi:hypothetical protein